MPEINTISGSSGLSKRLRVSVESQRIAALADAALRPDRRYTTADRQAVNGLLSLDIMSATLPGLVSFRGGPPRGVLQQCPPLP